MLRPLLGRPAGPEAGSDGSRPCAGGGYEHRIQQEVSNMAAPDQRGNLLVPVGRGGGCFEGGGTR
jgi:hypothetical protein